MSSGEESSAPDPLESVVARLVNEMAAAWRSGERPQAEEFLRRHPEIAQDPAAAVRVLYEEICLRQDLGQKVASQEVMARFPQWRAELAVLLDCHRLMAAPEEAPAFPAVGESLAGCRLLAVLGHGAAGRVYLATQSQLADRPVVLKVTPRAGHEHLSLARLQHTHIVPLYGVEDESARNLRALCMPYLGGAALCDLLTLMQLQPPGKRTGRDLVEALDQAQESAPLPLPATGPARQFLASASYPQAVCWMGACLADALQYAHERGLVHLDLKAANVLLTADGQPMLLDFHLARAPLRRGDAAPDWLGGTPGYSSPEQEAVLTAVRQGRPIPVDVDGRSDIYSLGLLLYEALGGDINPPYRARSLRRRNRQVSVGLADIVSRCLAPAPRDRYADAAALAEDLRRHLADLPLRHVANRSLTERWRKWRRRRPYALGLAAMVVAILLTALAAAAIALSNVGERLRQAEEALAAGQQDLKNHNYSRALDVLTQGLSLAKNTPGGGALTRALEAELRLARRARAAQELHAAANRVRFLLDPDSLSATEAQALEQRCRTIWEVRRQLLDRSVALNPETERRIQIDLCDLAILGVDLRVRLAPADKMDQARREALDVLGEAETLFGPSPALYRERHAHAAALRMPDVAEAAVRAASELRPRTAWDHYALGRFLLKAGDVERATDALEQALDLEPHNLWPHFYRGLCAYRLGRYQDAVTAFTAALTLAPHSAPCYYNRALAQRALGRSDRALHDYSRALEHDPALAAAWVNRGILLHQMQRSNEAIADLERALKCGADPPTVHYNLALVHLARQDRAAALICVHSALRHDRGHKSAADLLQRLQSGR